MLPYFQEVARSLIDSKGAEDSLAAALALATGNVDAPQCRSLLSAQTGWKTVLFQCDTQMRTNTFCWNAIRRHVLHAETDDKVRGMRLSMDRTAAVFDVPEDVAEAFATAKTDARGSMSFSVLTDFSDIPDLMPLASVMPQRRWGNKRGGGGGRFRGGGRGRGRGGGRGRFGGRGGGNRRNFRR